MTLDDDDEEKSNTGNILPRGYALIYQFPRGKNNDSRLVVFE